MKGLNLIIVLLLDLSIPGVNDPQNILPHEFIFVSRSLFRCMRRQLLKVLKLCCDINK